MKKRKLTPEQEAARDARRLKFKALWKQVSMMPPIERQLMADKCGLVTCEGHPLSPANTYLIILQCPGATVLGGFRQWRKMGRTVRKGQHGAMIWVPCGSRKTDAAPAAPTAIGEPTEDGDSRFITGTLFDISQTDEIVPGQKFTPEQAEEQEAPAAEPAEPAPAFIPEMPPTTAAPGKITAEAEKTTVEATLTTAATQDGFLF